MDYSAGPSGVVRAAVVQMAASGDVAANRASAERLVRRAAALGATLVVLPEKWTVMDRAARVRECAEALDGPSLTAARGWARALGVSLVAGSVPEATPGAGRVRNTSVAIDPEGAVVAVYRKIHLFDVDIAGRSYRESDEAVAGDAVVHADLAGLRIGMSVCYDLRFPELYRSLAVAGATALAVPSAFTAATGKDHWEPLLRARAIENQCFVLAANQVGTHGDGSRSHGRSMIVDPWGVVLAQVGDGEGVAVADLALDRLAEVRRSLPALRHRRPELY